MLLSEGSTILFKPARLRAARLDFVRRQQVEQSDIALPKDHVKTYGFRSRLIWGSGDARGSFVYNFSH